MEQTVEENIAFLQEAKEKSERMIQMRETCRRLEDEAKAADKALTNERKKAKDQVAGTIETRHDELEESYDLQIKQTQEKLRKIRQEREKVKNKGVQQRIGGETADLVAENSGLAAKMKTLFKQNKVPGICRTGWYYALFSPRGWKEILILLATILVCFGVVPLIAYLMVPPQNRSTLVLVLIYLAVIILFFGIWLIIHNMTKVKHREMIEEGRIIRDQMEANRRQINAIKKSIKSDSNEEMYNLGGYDEKIAEFEAEIADIEARKKQALDEFENELKPQITDEIMAGYSDRLSELFQDKKVKDERFSQADVERKNLALDLAENYEAYLGKSNMNPKRLEALIAIFEEGSATNLTEAIEYYKKNR